MSKLSVNELTDETGSGAPSFPNGMSVTGAALTDPEITGGIFLGGTGSANYLDDYEEGTWTPRLFQNDSEVTDAVYSFFNGGSYTKIGRLVTLNAIFRLDSKGSISDTGNVQIGNLPFTNIGGGIGERRGYAHFARNDSIANHLYGDIFGGVSTITLVSSSGVTGSDITNDTYLTFSVIYYTDS